MIVWIDIMNSPHVLFFEPVIAKLKEQGHRVIVTARDFSSTIKLLNEKNIEFKLIGKHGGALKINKFFRLLNREFRLYFYLRRKKVNVALGHASYDSAVVAKWLKIKSITAFDYEYAEKIHSVLLKNVSYCIVPCYIPKERLTKFGILKENIACFDGLKEMIYLKEFSPDYSKVSSIIDKQKINIVLRPPAEISEYYRGIGHPLFYKLCDYLHKKSSENVAVIVIPRMEKQVRFFLHHYPNFKILSNAFDGPQLIYWSDYMISAGGTMIREAAVLGTPAYTITDLKIGGVDEHLIKEKKMYKISNDTDIEELEFKKNKKKLHAVSDHVFNQYIDFILSK